MEKVKIVVAVQYAVSFELMSLLWIRYTNEDKERARSSFSVCRNHRGEFHEWWLPSPNSHRYVNANSWHRNNVLPWCKGLRRTFALRFHCSFLANFWLIRAKTGLIDDKFHLVLWDVYNQQSGLFFGPPLIINLFNRVK